MNDIEPTKKTDINIEAVQEFIDRYESLRTDGDDNAYLDAYMKAHAEISADEAGVRATAAYLRAGIDAAEQGRLADLRRRRSGLEWNHAEPIRQIVSAKIAGQKQRHIKTAHGKIGFRKQKATQKLNVFDENAVAEAWPDLVTMIPKIDKKALKEKLLAGERCAGGARLEETPERDNLYIDTGKMPELPVPAKRAALPEKEGD